MTTAVRRLSGRLCGFGNHKNTSAPFTSACVTGPLFCPIYSILFTYTLPVTSRETTNVLQFPRFILHLGCPRTGPGFRTSFLFLSPSLSSFFHKRHSLSLPHYSTPRASHLSHSQSQSQAGAEYILGVTFASCGAAEVALCWPACKGAGRQGLPMNNGLATAVCT